MATFDAAPGLPSVVDPDQRDRAGAYASLDQLAQLFAPLQQPPSTYVDFFTQLAATGTPPLSYQQSKANALNYAGVPVTGPYTAQPNQLILVDASAASVPITLPTNPTVNDLVAVVVSALTAPNVVTVSANGKAFNIAGGPQTLSLPLLGEIGQFQYVGGGIWVAAIMANPGAVDPAGSATAAAAAVSAQLLPQIQALAARPAPAPRSTSISPPGNFVLGLSARGPVVNVGYPVNGVRIRVDQSPVGSAATFQIANNTGALYGTPYTIPAAASSTTPYSFDDLSAGGWAIADGTQMKLKWTGIGSTFPGAGITVELVADVGGSTGIGIGADTALAAPTIGGASAGFTWQYSGGVPPSTHVLVAKQGTVAPSSPSDGISATVAGSASSGQVIGLTANTTYSAGVWPVAADGTLGTPAFLAGAQAFTTAAADTTPPGPVTSTKVTAGSTSGTPSWTNPTDADFHHVIARLKINTTSPFAAIPNNTQPTEGHPAATSTPSGTGAGTALPAGATTFTQTNLTASTRYVIGLFTVDAAGNINGTPVSIVFTTTAAATSGLGDNGKVPAPYQPVGSDSFTGAVGDNFAWDQGYKNGEQGPTDRSNVDIITDPADGTTKCLRMRMRIIANGWANSASSPYKNHQGWFYINGTSPAQYETDGTGWYGARGNAKWPSQASGAWEIVWKVANADGTAATSLGYGTKGLTWMVFPDTGWPDDELDAIEIFNATQLQANMHFKNSSGGNGQVWSGHGTTQPFNIFSKITSTLLWEPAPAGTGGTTGGGIGRIRLFHKQTGVTGDSGVGTPLTWFDTDKPYIADNATDDKMQRLLSAANPGQLGLAVAYNPGTNSTDASGNLIGSNFSCGTGTSGNARTGSAALIYKISQWKAA